MRAPWWRVARALLCVLVVGGVAAAIGWDWHTRRKATRALQAELPALRPKLATVRSFRNG